MNYLTKTKAKQLSKLLNCKLKTITLTYPVRGDCTERYVFIFPAFEMACSYKYNFPDHAHFYIYLKQTEKTIQTKQLLSKSIETIARSISKVLKENEKLIKDNHDSYLAHIQYKKDIERTLEVIYKSLPVPKATPLTRIQMFGTKGYLPYKNFCGTIEALQLKAKLSIDIPITQISKVLKYIDTLDKTMESK